MTRQEKIAKHFQKEHLLTVSNSVYKNQVFALFDWMVVADNVRSDLTTKALNLQGNGVAEIISKQDAVIAGMEEVIFCLKQKTSIVVLDAITDGSRAKKGDVLLRITGDVSQLLGYERIVLNILGRMSGIATYTDGFVSLMQFVNNAPLLVSTRKTPWMMLDKKAVVVGGGGTHRLSLSDFVLVKDTHLSVYAFQDAMQAIIKTGDFFEIEVANTKQADTAIDILEKAKYKEAAIMLDNVTPKIAKEFMEKFKLHPFFEHIYIETSGEVTKENIINWAQTGVDVISSGSLTHSAPTCNVSMLTRALAF